MNYPTEHGTDTPVEPGQNYYAVTNHTISYGRLAELGFDDDEQMAIMREGGPELSVVDYPIHFHTSFGSAHSHWVKLQEARHDNRP